MELKKQSQMRSIKTGQNRKAILFGQFKIYTK